MSTGPLSIDVYVAPMRPYTSPDQLGEGEVATWAPSSSTLISGPTEGILIDALLTFENADQIAAWAKSFGKKITGVYITHGHGDHWLGLARLLEHFPEARGYAAPEVAARAAWEADINKTTNYVRDFTAVAKKGGTVEDLVHGMLELHGERDQPHTLWISARAEVARQG
jgi:glyoxylase-like metal-dependent hydrolase (beta-lactamase superfamily II)